MDGLSVCHFGVYCPSAPVSGVKHDGSPSCVGAPDGCLYIKTLDDVDKKALKELVQASVKRMKQLIKWYGKAQAGVMKGQLSVYRLVQQGEKRCLNAITPFTVMSAIVMTSPMMRMCCS